ncbi:MAG: hypothetical protein N2202_02785 [Proteobacteria bacterium]|nr:hypothetical protein [Pseudomonadota bacterium]
MDEILERYKKKKVLNALENNIDRFYKSLPYFIENYTKFKFIPFSLSTELLDEIDKSFKNLKEVIQTTCFPYEEKNVNFDYLFDVTPLVGREYQFLKNILYYDNLIDKRTIEKWITYSGRNLKRKLMDIFLKVSREFKDPWSGQFLFMIILIINFSSLKNEIVKINLGKVTNERKDMFFSYFFYFYLKLILEELAEEIKDENLMNYINFSYISPLNFCEIKTSFLRYFYNFWELSNREYSLFESYKFYDAFEKLDDIYTELKENSEIIEESTKSSICNFIRKEIFNFLAVNYHNGVFFRHLAMIIYNPMQLQRFCFDRDYRFDVYKLSKDVSGNQEILEKINTFKNDLERKIQDLKSKPINDFLKKSLLSYFRFKCHFNIESNINELIKAFKDRRVEKSLDLKDEYENGRLYYFSFDNKSVIKESTELRSAAIYIDIRDFSKKTFKLKEQTIGELLKDKFYAPILHYASDKTLSEEILLHNIVGDSIIFSGSIEEIIKLAIVIKRDSEEYKSGLEHVIFDESKKELLAVDLGIFIAYGKKPMIFNIPSEYGNLNIALGETINLASRGSKRDFNAKRRLDYIIDYESKVRGINVKLPFNVYIVEGYSFIMPPSLENKLLNITDLNEEQKIISSYFEQLKLDVSIDDSNLFWSKQKFIYNIGIGLTEEAFLAFLQVLRVYSNIKKIIINVKQLPEDIQKKYYFKSIEMEFCYIKHRKSGEVYLFRKEGGIVFKGYDNETIVWELITKEMPVYNELISTFQRSNLI